MDLGYVLTCPWVYATFVLLLTLGSSILPQHQWEFSTVARGHRLFQSISSRWRTPGVEFTSVSTANKRTRYIWASGIRHVNENHSAVSSRKTNRRMTFPLFCGGNKYSCAAISQREREMLCSDSWWLTLTFPSNNKVEYYFECCVINMPIKC